MRLEWRRRFRRKRLWHRKCYTKFVGHWVMLHRDSEFIASKISLLFVHKLVDFSIFFGQWTAGEHSLSLQRDPWNKNIKESICKWTSPIFNLVSRQTACIFLPVMSLCNSKGLRLKNSNLFSESAKPKNASLAIIGLAYGVFSDAKKGIKLLGLKQALLKESKQWRQWRPWLCLWYGTSTWNILKHPFTLKGSTGQVTM